MPSPSIINKMKTILNICKSFNNDGPGIKIAKMNECLSGYYESVNKRKNDSTVCKVIGILSRSLHDIHMRLTGFFYV